MPLQQDAPASARTPRDMVTVTREGGVAVLVLDNPPVNSLVVGLRAALLARLAEIAADPSVSALVLIGGGRAFSAGADLRELDKPSGDPTLAAVVAALEKLDKPVVAAISGPALGGGLEIALACDLRLASGGATLGLPETRLGIVPGAGGTQRLPRLVGIPTAAALIGEAQVLGAQAALAMGLIDGIVGGDLRAEATAAARRAPKRRLSALTPPAGEVSAAVAVAGRPSVAQALALVELAARVPFAEGLRRERETFLRLRDGEEARALRHLFLAERSARRQPGQAAATPRRVAAAAVVGAGTMGAGIAAALAEVGIAVTIVERDAAAAAAGWHRLVELFERRRARNRLTAAEVDDRLARLSVTCEWDGLSAVDLAIEAASEDLEVKRSIFARLGAATAPGTVLASNTSYLDLEALADASSRPADTVGLHFFAPVGAMRLLEVGQARRTSAETLATALSLARRLDKVAVVAKAAPGLIGNRIFAAYRRHMEYLVADGAAPREIDDALTAYGFSLGPFAVADLSGLDIAWAERRRTASLRDPAQRYVAIADRLCEAGRLGRKTGAGWYRYGERRGELDAELERILAEERGREGRPQRRFTPLEIQTRALAVLANEAAKVLAEGISARASDIDLVFVNGYGFPRERGGPLHAADRFGLPAVLHEIEAAAAGGGEVAGPAPLLRELVATKRPLSDVGRGEPAGPELHGLPRE